MASKQSEAVTALWRTMTEAAAANPNQTPDEIRESVEKSWPGLTGEPGGTDYQEVEVAGLAALWAVPHDSAEDRVLLCVHGGGNVSGSVYTHRKLYGHVAKTTGVRALISEYRPEPFPAPIDDTIAAFRWLLDQGVRAEHVAMVGDSLGAGLSMSAMLRTRELGLPMASALTLISPWVDMTVSSETFETNRKTDAFFSKEVVSVLAGLYLNGTDPKDPLASPLHADLDGMPPIYIQIGGDETLLGEGLQLGERARAAGVDVEVDVFPDQQHTFQMAAGYAPEADDAIRRMAQWLRLRLGLANA